MNHREIKKEANLLYKAVLPLLEREDFERVVLTDLATIVQLCGRSKGEVTSDELLAFLVIFALIKQDKAKLQVAIEQWDRSSEAKQKAEKETLRLLLELTHDQTNQLALPSLLNKLDEEKSTNYLAKIVNAIYRFAQIMVKADGNVTMQEMEALSQIWQLLHSYDTETANKQAAPASFSLPVQNVDDVLAELNKLVGMENIKRK